MPMEIAKDWSILPEDQAETVIYGIRNGTALRMLAMKPVAAADSASPAPCLIFIHGGGFTGGNAEMLLPYCRYFVRRGFACFSVDYRLMKTDEDGAPLEGETTLAECIADCKAAVRYVRRHARLWNGDPDRIVLAGESAGGYLASAVTALHHVEEDADLSVSCVPQFLVVFNPITQLLSKWKTRVEQPGESASGDDSAEDRWLARHRRARELSPLLHLTAAHPATLAVHGLEDTVVLPEDSAEYAVRLRQFEVEAQLVLLPDCQHAFALTNYKSPDEMVERIMALTARFLADHCLGTMG